MLSEIRRILKPGALFVMIDLVRDEAVHKTHGKGWVTDHVRAGQKIFEKEIDSVGFSKVKQFDDTDLVENYMLLFKNTLALDKND